LPALALAVLVVWVSSAAAAAHAVSGAASGAAPAAAPASASVTATSPAASAAPTHRPLRENQPTAALEPTEPQTFKGYPAAPAFSVVPRKQHLALFPCSQCHKVLPLNTQPRKLVNAPHPAALDHGKGRMWCLDCHQGNDRDALHTVGGAKVDFDQSYLVCGQCHSARQRDWFFGAHGKRVAGWKGEREIYSCTHCHDPHSPTLKPRAPSAPPPLRAGLAPMTREREPTPMPWQRASQGTHDGQAARP
jgi:hypothetical protein